ncbi:hypothetical protein HK100_011110 [Physocladia obscura]|uniref:Glycosyltransferase n=1 Tax=Physocladia obscura TaxID=109957 RepID=A0AAD5T9L7_9FUNG|nr:hypothetical protein HK100_011110 [Physocladia obscura]
MVRINELRNSVRLVNAGVLKNTERIISTENDFEYSGRLNFSKLEWKPLLDVLSQAEKNQYDELRNEAKKKFHAVTFFEARYEVKQIERLPNLFPLPKKKDNLANDLDLADEDETLNFSNFESETEHLNVFDGSENDLNEYTANIEARKSIIDFKKLSLSDNISKLAEAAGIDEKLIKKLLFDRLKNTLGSEELDEIIVEKRDDFKPITKWNGDKNYIYKDGLPTCLEAPESHCIVSMEPSLSTNQNHFTNFSPIHDSLIGEKIKRARFIGNNICQTFNASKNDLLHYIGVHQCPKARQMIVPLPKAKTRPQANINLKKRKKKKMLDELHGISEISPVLPNLIVRYIKIDKIRYHQFHNPAIITFPNSFISTEGYVFNDKIIMQLGAHCSDSVLEDPHYLTVLQEFQNSVSIFPEVFVASTSIDRGVFSPHWLLLEILPRIVSHFKELNANPHIHIHYNGGGKQFLTKVLRFLGLSEYKLKNSGINTVEGRLISGPVASKIVHIPEPSLSCLIPGEWQLNQMRSLIMNKLALDFRQQQRAWREILVVKSNNGIVDNHDAVVYMIKKEFRSFTVRVLIDGGDDLSSVRETFAMFHAAKIIIAPEGAALGYLVASRFASSIIEILPEPQNKASWNLSYSTAARYLGVTWFGMVLPKESKTVDLVELHGVIVAIIADVK